MIDMNRFITRARRAGVPVLAPPGLALGGCGDFEDSLLEPQQPGVILPEDIESAGATGADALRIGALGRLKAWTAGGGDGNQENIVLMADLLTDTWKSSDTFTQRNDTDRRAVKTNDGVVGSAYATMASGSSAPGPDPSLRSG